VHRNALKAGPAGALVLATAVLLSGCRPARPAATADKPAGPPWFADVTRDVGLNFVHDAGPSPERYQMPQIMGSGAALFDFDNDGRLDLYLIQNGGPDSKSTNRLFRQRADGRFEDVSAGSGLDVAGYGMGVAVGDVNNDGWPDVLITEYGRVRLFLNNGNGTFTDITKEAGLDNPHWGTSACFVDYDRDGWLDLVVVNYVVYSPTRPCSDQAGRPDFCGPGPFPGTVTRLFRNLGVEREAWSAERQTPGAPRSTLHAPRIKGAPRSALRAPRLQGAPRFKDVTLESGLGARAGPGLGVVCADFNGDHWPDIFVANDGKPNHLWINQRDGTFKEEALVRGLAYNGLGQAPANMGIALGDVDGDGLFDLFLPHLAEELHVFWKQGPVGQFHDQTAAAGLANPRWRSTGFGTVFGDFDLDGALDLALANGAVKHPAMAHRSPGGAFWSQFSERNQLFAGDGTGRFRDISLENEAFCGTAAISRALACGDIDNDGALDLLVTQVAGPARLFRNIAPRRGHWLLVRAIDPALGGRDAYGAEITVEAGGRRWLRLVNPGYSYLCSNDPRVHFGLGSVTHVDAIHVIWPDGSEETFPGGGVDQAIVLRKASGAASAPRFRRAARR
jgi:hypothetical protein